MYWCVTVFYQQIENSNIANQIHGFTIDYGKFILITFNIHFTVAIVAILFNHLTELSHRFVFRFFSTLLWLFLRILISCWSIVKALLLLEEKSLPTSMFTISSLTYDFAQTRRHNNVKCSNWWHWVEYSRRNKLSKTTKSLGNKSSNELIHPCNILTF